MHFRIVCKTIHQMFCRHVDNTPLFWMPMLISSGFVWATCWATDYIADIGIIATLREFRDIAELTSRIDCLYVAITNSSDKSALASCVTECTRTDCAWRDGAWAIDMDIIFHGEQDSLLRYEPYTNEFGEEEGGVCWQVNVRIELFLCSHDGMLKIADLDIKRGPTYTYVGHHYSVCFDDDALTIYNIVDCFGQFVDAETPVNEVDAGKTIQEIFYRGSLLRYDTVVNTLCAPVWTQ